MIKMLEYDCLRVFLKEFQIKGDTCNLFLYEKVEIETT